MKQKKNKKEAGILLSNLDFGQRYREIDLSKSETQKEIAQLAQDIRKVGLIHPITVLDKSKIENKKHLESIETDPSKPYLLLAGGRRTTAFIEGDISDTIPAYVYKRVLSVDQMREIELMENLSRKELSWQENAKLTKEYHDLQQSIHGKKVTSSGKGHGLKETAEDMGVSKSTVQKEIDLAKALEHLPTLSNIKNKSDALKALKEVVKTDKASIRATNIKKERATKGLGKVKEELMDSYVVGDFFQEAEKLKANTFDIIEIDPPYGIDLGNVKKNSKHKTLNYNEVPSDEYKAFMQRTLAYAKKLIKPNGWLIVWYAIEPWHDTMLTLIREAGFKTNGLPALWIKNGGQTNRPQHYFGSCYEPFIYARASEDSKLNRPGTANYLLHPKVPPESKIHPTQRPVSLMEDCLTRFKAEGKVLVPFAGSGVTIRAAHNLGMKAIGYDLSEDAKNKSDIIVNNYDGKKFTL